MVARVENGNHGSRGVEINVFSSRRLKKRARPACAQHDSRVPNTAQETRTDSRVLNTTRTFSTWLEGLVLQERRAAFKTEERIDIPQIVMPLSNLFPNRRARILFGLCCPVAWSIYPLAEISEPYEEEGYYIAAEEYAHFERCHMSEIESAGN
jgi:hypothetical protein